VQTAGDSFAGDLSLDEVIDELSAPAKTFD
jgi:hypothetical protein